jgi:prophage DNA circulation protein
MEPGKGALEEALAAIESETRHLVHAEARSTSTAETDVDIAPLVHEVGATSIAEIEKLIAELQEARDFLQSEGERVRRETERYTNLTQTASASVKIISDTVAGWREAGHPLRNQTRSGTPSPTEDVTGSLRVPDEELPQPQAQVRARTRGKEPLN